MAFEILELTEEQKQIARDLHGSGANLSTITQKTFPDAIDANGNPVDGRSTEGKSVRAFIASIGGTVKTVSHVKGANLPPIVLTDEQKQFIETNAEAFRGKPLEMVRVLFNNDKLPAISREAKVVYAHLREVYPDVLNATDEPVEDAVYQLPATVMLLCGVVNTYVFTSDLRKVYQWGTLKPFEERCLRSLMSYMRNFRFPYQCNQYDKKADRELFISTFIRFAHDKPDLTQIEIDQVISAAVETVNIVQIQRLIRRMDKMQEEVMEGLVTDDNGKVKKLNMVDVEAINQVRSKEDTAKGRVKQLLEALEETRSKRTKDRADRAATILNLLEVWQNDEQMRQDIIDMGIEEKNEDAKEFGRIRDFDDITAIIAGQSPDEAAR